jgi:hypothetical protein
MMMKMQMMKFLTKISVEHETKRRVINVLDTKIGRIMLKMLNSKIRSITPITAHYIWDNIFEDLDERLAKNIFRYTSLKEDICVLNRHFREFFSVNYVTRGLLEIHSKRPLWSKEKVWAYFCRCSYE